MATNNFKPFATGSSANVTTQSDYEALAALLSGFQSGKASSAQINKALRQGTVMSAMLGAFLNDRGLDAKDDGNINALMNNFKSALISLSDTKYLATANRLIEFLNAGSQAQADARFNIGCGSAAARAVGTASGNIPDMSSFASQQTSSGYQQLPGGFVLQWINTTAPDGVTSGSVALPIAFNNQTLVAFVCDSITTGSPSNVNLAWSINATTKSSISWVSTATGVGAFTVLAIGR
ncbi:gp53-like domain-containing protein [Pantoea eucalypti]|uniref:gp53-like domain-containing protein n=1 Tax=Pantoea eucalypti TaxID=470933 RepID=UPI00301C6EBD